MSEALGDPQQLEVAGSCERSQVKACPLPEVRGTPAEIHRDIPDLARENTYQLSLWLPELVM